MLYFQYWHVLNLITILNSNLKSVKFIAFRIFRSMYMLAFYIYILPLIYFFNFIYTTNYITIILLNCQYIIIYQIHKMPS